MAEQFRRMNIADGQVAPAAGPAGMASTSNAGGVPGLTMVAPGHHPFMAPNMVPHMASNMTPHMAPNMAVHATHAITADMIPNLAHPMLAGYVPRYSPIQPGPAAPVATHPHYVVPGAHYHPAMPAVVPFHVLTDAELDAKFADFEAECQDDDFQNEMNTWMSQHGPASNIATPQDLADAITERMTDDAERIADDMERFIKEDRVEIQDGLAKSAHDILQSVSDNSSEKFQQSSFFALMRRITAGEVVLEGDDLIVKETGMSVVPSRGEAAQNEGNGKGKGKAVATDDGYESGEM